MSKVGSVAAWAFFSLCVIAVITLPVNLQTQLIVSVLIVTFMAVLKLANAGGRWRLIALAFGTAVVLRYVYWRTTSTLPPLNQPENFIPGFLLYLAEMYSVMMLSLSLFVVAMPLPPRKASSISPGKFPKVDVFVPSYNEDAGLLANTLAAAKAMDYPADKLTVWLLDDGGTLQSATRQTSSKRSARPLAMPNCRRCATISVCATSRASATNTPRPATSTMACCIRMAS